MLPPGMIEMRGGAEGWKAGYTLRGTVGRRPANVEILWGREVFMLRGIAPGAPASFGGDLRRISGVWGRSQAGARGETLLSSRSL